MTSSVSGLADASSCASAVARAIDGRVDVSATARSRDWLSAVPVFAAWNASANCWYPCGSCPYQLLTRAAAQAASRFVWHTLHAFGVPMETERSGRGTRRL